MSIIFIILAALMLLMYLPYILTILAGRPQRFEDYVKRELARLISELRDGAPRTMMVFITFALAFEISYFITAWFTVRVLAYQLITIGITCFEAYHILRTIFFITRFFTNRAPLGRIFNWIIERLAAVLLFSHALIGLLLLLVP